MSRRSYEQYCGLAKALDVVGERWTLLVVRNLLLGPLRYSELLRGLPGITTNLLAKRLKEMEEHGLLERIRAGAGEGGQAYRLTEVGRALEPAVHALGRWGWRWMGTPAGGEHRSLEWLMVALRRRYRGGAKLVAELVVGDVPYTFRLAEGVEIARGAAGQADVRASGPADAFARLFLGGWPESGLPDGVRVTAGGIGGLHALVEAFERGDPVPVAPTVDAGAAGE
jgi:DNA-binding HxlR family transcriptional regulator